MRALVIAVLALSVAVGARAQVPDTPAGRQLTAWLAAFNNPDGQALRHFLEVNAPDRLPQIERAFDLRARTGGFEFKKVDESAPTRLAVLAQERASDQLVRIAIEVDPAEPHRITSISLSPAPRPAELAIQRLSESALVATLRAKLEQDAAADRFAGAVLIAKDGKPVFDAAYGLADREKRIPNTLDTRFRLGSMNKMFTAVAVLQLVQAGRIALDSPLVRYLPDYPNTDAASRVTIHQLLTHTGGTGDFFGPEYAAHRLELQSLHAYVARFGTRDLAFPPGSKWEYSNFGFILLGAVIEKVSGTSYYAYVASHVYAPAGMSSTGSDPEDSVVANRAVGYMKAGGSGGWQSNAETLPYRGTSAGGGYSTVGDLLRFATALREHKLLNPHYTELLTTGKVDAAFGKYAYGFSDRTISGMRFVGHGGGAPGMNGDLEIDPQSGYVVAVLSNLDPPAATRISDFITNRLPFAEARRPPSP